MAKRAKAAFDPKVFLATVNHGRKISLYRKGAVVFRQATAADAVFYVRKGRIKIVVSSSEGREAVIALLGPGEFFGTFEFTHKKSGRKVVSDIFPFHNWAFQEGLLHAENLGGDIEHRPVALGEPYTSAPVSRPQKPPATVTGPCRRATPSADP